jgi:tRNA pseudouridine13 synthase
MVIKEKGTAIISNNNYSVEKQLSSFYNKYWGSDDHRPEVKFFTNESDFVVREVYNEVTPDITEPYPETKDQRLFLNYTLVKTNISTFDCAKMLAEYFNVEDEDIGYSGLKDNFAITSQLISVPLDKVPKEKLVAGHRFNKFFLKDPHISTSPKYVGSHLGNSFTIRFYTNSLDMKTKQCIISNLEKVHKYGIPNIYGIQRFGPRGVNHIVGKKLVARDYEGAALVWLTSSVSKWELGELIKAKWGNWEECLKIISERNDLDMERRFFRSMISKDDFAAAFESIPLGKFFVRSFSSFLFNEALYRVMQEGNSDNKDSMLIRIGYDTQFSDEESKIYSKILSDNGVLLKDFKFDDYPDLSQSGGKRDVLVFPQNCSVSFDSKGGTISFSLGKGMYATVVLNFLFKEADYNKQL